MSVVAPSYSELDQMAFATLCISVTDAETLRPQSGRQKRDFAGRNGPLLALAPATGRNNAVLNEYCQHARKQDITK